MGEFMDFEKYYDVRKDGSYIVHFPNNKGFSTMEIIRMFSVYGQVLAVNNRGEERGLCFIKYGNLEDVKRCINGFKGHQYVKILVHKNKLKIDNTKTKPQNSGQNKSKNYSKNQYKSNKRTNNSIKNNEDFSNTSCSSWVETIDGDSTKHLQRDKQLNDMDEIPALVTVEESLGIDERKFSVSSPTVIVAQEVIVANIHHSLSIHYILHLFEKYNPIAVSLMMKIPKSGIRYCHVYYKTSADASATVEEFDKCLLRGKNLMVLTSQELTQEESLL